MDVKTINISQIYSLDGNATLKCFLASQSDEMAKYNQNLPALIIAPGGAYSFVSDREADPIALDFFTKHYNTFVLTYSVAPEGRYPLATVLYTKALIDAGIKYECHIFSQGEHGGSTFDSRTCKNEPSTNKIWFDLADNFLKGL